MGRVLNRHRDGVPEGAVYIGRGSPYGNPFRMGEMSRDEVCSLYEAELRGKPDLVSRIRREIGTRDVVCFCSQPGRHVRCHGDVVVGVATMTEKQLRAWMSGSFSLRGFDPNRESVDQFISSAGMRHAASEEHDSGLVREDCEMRFDPSMDVTRSDADIIVNTVNCVGVMGKGVALAFRKAYPHHYEAYQAECAQGAWRPGDARLYPREIGRHDGRYIAALATKDHWRDPSRLEWVEKALLNLASLARAAGVRSIALPPPGCGNGGLEWAVVQPLVERHLAGFHVTVSREDSRRSAPERVHVMASSFPAEREKERAFPDASRSSLGGRDDFFAMLQRGRETGR